MQAKAIKYRLYPTKKQEKILSKIFGCQRFIYNYFLNERKQKYQDFKDGKISKKESHSSYTKNSKALTRLKQELPWLYESPASSLQKTLKNLDNAYCSFFKKTSKFPKFKSKHNNNASFSMTYINFKIINSEIKSKHFGTMRFVEHKSIEGRILSSTISNCWRLSTKRIGID